MTAPRTSLSDPLHIAALSLPDGGAIGITFCPGKQQAQAQTGAWARAVEVQNCSGPRGG